MKILAGASYFTIGFFKPISGFMFTTFFLILVDFITGILGANKQIERKRKAGEEILQSDLISSSRMSDTVIKLGIFVLVIISVEVFRLLMLGDLQDFLGLETIPITMLVAGVITVSEIQSIRENIIILYRVDILGFIPEKFRGFFGKINIKK